MPPSLGELPILYLIRRKFGDVDYYSQHHIDVLKTRNGVKAEECERRNVEMRLYRMELGRKSSAEIDALQAAEFAKEDKELFGSAADFDHWSRMADWTLDQAIALSFGRAPELVNWPKVQSHVHWSVFAREYSKVRDRALSFVRWRQLYDPVLPTLFLAWARRDGLDVPKELTDRIEARGNVIADWKDLFEHVQRDRDRLSSALTAVTQERDTATARLAEVSTTLSAMREKPLITRERETALKLIIGLAVDGLGYDPAALKSPIPSEITKKLDKLGIPLDSDTVRKWLREAAELLPKGRK